MAIGLTTSNTETFLKELTKFIGTEAGNAGSRTWELTSKGNFTHSADQYRMRACFIVSSHDKDSVILKLKMRSGEKELRAMYGLYHGRFIELLVTHFSSYILEIEVTPDPEKGVDDPEDLDS